MHELLGVTIFPLHGIYDDVSPSLPTSIMGVTPPYSFENGSLANVYFIHT
jgi:hypothetical protein